MNLLQLPVEIILRCTRYLTVKEHRRTARTCRRLYGLCNDDFQTHRALFTDMADTYTKARTPVGKTWLQLCRYALENQALRKARPSEPSQARVMRVWENMQPHMERLNADEAMAYMMQNGDAFLEEW